MKYRKRGKEPYRKNVWPQPKAANHFKIYRDDGMVIRWGGKEREKQKEKEILEDNVKAITDLLWPSSIAEEIVKAAEVFAKRVEEVARKMAEMNAKRPMHYYININGETKLLAIACGKCGAVLRTEEEDYCKNCGCRIIKDDCIE